MRDHRDPAPSGTAYVERLVENITDQMRDQGPKIVLSAERKRKRKASKAAKASRRRNRA